MINFMVWVRKPKGIFGTEYTHNEKDQHFIIERYLKAQIDNSLELGWEPKQIRLITNVPFSYRQVKGIPHTSVINGCSFTNKWTALQQYWRNEKHDVWYHDLDAWPLEKFSFPKEVEHVGFTSYINGMQGGSVFFRYSARDILDEYINFAKHSAVVNDEHVWTQWQKDKFKNKITVLDTTYNVGRMKWKERYDSATKPIKVIHIKPDEDWSATVNVHGKTIKANAFLTPTRLEFIFVKHGIWHKNNLEIKFPTVAPKKLNKPEVVKKSKSIPLPKFMPHEVSAPILPLNTSTRSTDKSVVRPIKTQIVKERHA